MKPQLHRESSLALLLFAAIGAGLALALAALVAGGGIELALLVFAGTVAFGLAADGRADIAPGRSRRFR